MRPLSLLSLLSLIACDGKESDAVDADGDGFTAEEDCDDSDASVSPDAAEVCDELDNNCDGAVDEGVTTAFYADADGDSFGDPGAAQDACTAPSGYVADSTDCDDSDASAFPGGEEVCDGADNDCNGMVDDDAADAVTFYRDEDGDGYGVTEVTQAACAAPDGYAEVDGDCDDTEPALSPETVWHEDSDGDGYGSPFATTVSCTAPEGHVLDGTDCLDGDAGVFPGADEYCDGLDNDCSGYEDEDYAVDATAYYPDADGDGYGDDRLVQYSCTQPKDTTPTGGDCDDTNDTVAPGARELCDDGLDNDCEGTVDEVCVTVASDAVTAMVSGAGGDFGHRLSVGDVSGDGVGDLMVTAATFNTGASSAGRAYVFFGPLTSGAALAASDADVTASSASSSDYLGTSADMGSDIDSDGYVDLLLGAYGDDDVASSAGSVWIYYGPLTSGDVLTEADVDVKVTGQASSDTAGRYITRGLDVDDDGKQELLLGAHQADATSSADGIIAIFSKPADGDDLSDADAWVVGSASSGNVGYSFESIGDFDGDGDDDFIYGEIGEERAYILAGPLDSGTWSAADAEVTFDDSVNTNDDGGSDLASGDLNSDGYTDYLVASREDDAGGSNAGAIYLYNGTAAGLSGTITSASADARIYEDTASCYIGGVYGKLLVSDLNSDGYDDLLTSSFTHDGYVTSGGGGFVFYGPVTGDVLAREAGRAVVSGTRDEELGRYIAYGDVDGDGASDLLLSSVDTGSGSGAVYIFHGF